MANSKHCVNVSTTKLTLTILDLAQIFLHKAWRREKRNVFAVISFALSGFLFLFFLVWDNRDSFCKSVHTLPGESEVLF